jgi:NAD(P)-dependent dehydrogenase (short-subunit alcohol dehydrogenase family)
MEKRKKVALITGGARGIGLGIARYLGAEGIKLVLCGRKSPEEVKEVIDGLKEIGTHVIYVKCDISSAEDRKRLLDEIWKEFGQLNILINNAGVAPRERKDLLEATEEDFEWLMKINLQGPYFLTQSVANLMIQQKAESSGFSGSIVNVTSISAEFASVNRGEYCVSKAGLSMMSKLFATKLGEHNIPVYEVRPGIIKTDMTSGVTEKYDKLIDEGLTIQPQWGTPDNIGRAVLSLVKGDFSYASGQVFTIDGGLTVPRL